MKAIEVFREHRREIEEIAWSHTAADTYEIVIKRWKIGSKRAFYNSLKKENITTYQRTAAETMTLEEKERFTRKWTETIEIINKWRRKK